MQLSHAPVGYGVLESTVNSGKVALHPIKRLRTTLTFLAVAMLGTDAERAKYREAVNGAHRQVRSTSTSPVRYNAFDPQLQKWVAACLYFGTVNLFERMHGAMDPAVADAVYRDSVHFGSSLQMRPEIWPADRAAFAEYWRNGLAEAHIDEPVRRYLCDIIEMKALSKPARVLFGRSNRFFTVGLLPPDLRRQMGYEWSDATSDAWTARCAASAGSTPTCRRYCASSRSIGACGTCAAASARASRSSDCPSSGGFRQECMPPGTGTPRAANQGSGSILTLPGIHTS